MLTHRACTIDMEAFNQVLINNNYDNYDYTHKFRVYKRGWIHIDVQQLGESDENIDHRCIYKVVIRTLDDNGHIL